LRRDLARRAQDARADGVAHRHGQPEGDAEHAQELRMF
jgi:hypothetical protein